MPALKAQRSWSKKPRSNPYAERGLDQFALLSAELQAARERLVAQLGTPLSLVRFTVSPDQGKWIPIIVAPTSSKAEMRALRRAASDLITGGKHAFDAHHIVAGDSFSEATKHLGSTIGEHNTHVRFSISENNMAHDGNTHLGSTISNISIESSCVDTKSGVGLNSISKHDHQTETLGYLMAVLQGFLWMVNITAFSIRIIVDIVWSGQYTDGVTAVRALPSSSPKDKNAIIDHPSADTVSSSSHARPPPSIARKDIKRALPPLLPHVEAPKTHTQSKDSKLLSAPCSPRGSQQLTKPFSASVSLPKMARLPGHAPHGDIKEDHQKKIPNKVLKNTSTSSVDATASYPEKLGQALSAAGVVIILGGLVMGYIPAIVSVVCWWYVLPRMRKAVGDKPFVRSNHHHSSQEDKSNATLNNKGGGGTSVAARRSAKDDLLYHEKKKKIIMDGLLERPHHHSHLRHHSNV